MNEPRYSKKLGEDVMYMTDNVPVGDKNVEIEELRKRERTNH